MQHLHNFETFINESEDLNESIFGIENEFVILQLAQAAFVAASLGIAGMDVLIRKIKRSKNADKLESIIKAVEGLKESDQAALRKLGEEYLKSWTGSSQDLVKNRLIEKMKDLIGEEKTLLFTKMLDGKEFAKNIRG
jgi:Skp family chaperone for outer membrane proteins